MNEQQLKDERDRLLETYIFLERKTEIIARDIQLAYINAQIRSLTHGRDNRAKGNR